MISLSQSLLRGQKGSVILDKNFLLKCVLTYDSTEYSYTKTLIKRLSYNQEYWSHKANLLLDDTDKTLHSLDLEGYKAVISSGLVTRGGEEWIARPPLWVVGQDRDSHRDRLECSLSMEGIFDRMAKHKATASYTPDSGDTRTVKDWLTEIISLTDPDSESTEEQTTALSDMAMHADARYYVGQRLTISERTITKLAFQLKKVGSPIGDVGFSIISVDPAAPLVAGTVLARKVWGDAFNLGTTYAWIEVTFDTPVQTLSLADIRITCDFQGGDANNRVDILYNNSSVKANEHLTEIYLTTWTDRTGYDCAYKYTYSATPVTVYDGFPAYGLVFDSEDDLIDTFIPADSFRINLNDSRLLKVQELMRYTDCVATVGNDGLIHISVPTTSGTTYDYEYSLVEGIDYHNFFSKRYRRRIVSPNYIIFKSHPAHVGGYTGFAKDASADLTDMKEIETRYVRATSNAQCTNLATAYLSKLQMAAEKGSAVIPFTNFGQEIYDYVNVVDARAGDERAGNIGFFSIFYEPGQFIMSFGFGRFSLAVAFQGLTEGGITAESLMPKLFQLQGWIRHIIDILDTKTNFDDVEKMISQYSLSEYEDAEFRSLTVTERLRIPFGTDKYG